MPQAAVALIEHCADENEFLLLQRAVHPNDPWSGHLSFPGGRKEEADLDLLATCIRETAEESGIILNQNQMHCRLPNRQTGHHNGHGILVAQPVCGKEVFW